MCLSDSHRVWGEVPYWQVKVRILQKRKTTTGEGFLLTWGLFSDELQNDLKKTKRNLSTILCLYLHQKSFIGKLPSFRGRAEPFLQDINSSHAYIMLYHFLSFFLFIYLFQREKARMGGRAKREADRESQAGSKLSAPAWCAAPTHKPWDRDLSQSQVLNWLSHPDAPVLSFSKCLPFIISLGWGRYLTCA